MTIAIDTNYDKSKPLESQKIAFIKLIRLFIYEATSFTPSLKLAKDFADNVIVDYSNAKDQRETILAALRVLRSITGDNYLSRRANVYAAIRCEALSHSPASFPMLATYYDSTIDAIMSSYTKSD